MYDPIHPVFYHFWSSGLVGLLGLGLMYLISSLQPSTAPNGSVNWMSLPRFCLLLLLAVWVHIPADIIEHGYQPRIASGIAGLIEFLLSILHSVL